MKHQYAENVLLPTCPAANPEASGREFEGAERPEPCVP